MFPGFKPFKSNFILYFFKHLWKHSTYLVEWH